MKTSTFKTMFVAGLMLLSTATTFGKTSTNVQHHNRHNTRTEVIVVNNHHGIIDRHMRPGMERRFFINHIMEGRHFFGHNHECKVCHLTRREIHEVERELRHNHHAPARKHNHYRR